MIYIEFCIRQSILNFLGVSYFFGGRPPKIPTFSGSEPKRLERGPQCSSRRRNFQKLLHTIVVLRIGYIFHSEKLHLLPISTVPHAKNQKTAIIVQLWVICESWWRGILVFGRRCNFTSVTSSPYAELK